MKMTDNHFGLELILDIIECNDNIKDEKAIKKYVTKLCKIIQMKKYGKCYLKHFGHNSDKTSGYSMFQFIETSSIVCHFSEKYKTMHLNVFSCKDFDEVKATNFTLEYFGGKAVTNTAIERIMKYEKS